MRARLRVGYVGWKLSAMPPKCPARLGTPSASVRFRTSLVPCLRQYPKAGDSFHLVFYRMIGETKGES